MNSLEFVKDITCLLTEKAGISGYEQDLIPTLQKLFGSFKAETFSDTIGNFYAVKNGTDHRQSVMLAAHVDEIGLMITHVDSRGFLHFTTVGGIDERTLLYQEVWVHGKEEIIGIICLASTKLNPHQQKPNQLSELVIDIGCSYKNAVEKVRAGDVVSIRRTSSTLLNNRISGKALDDRTGVAVLAICLNELKELRHKHKVIAVATVQEEVGLRGALTSSDHLCPELAIAIDVTHAQTVDSKNQVSIQLGKGPVISLGPNIHPEIYTKLTDCAKENRISYQIQPAAGPTGTDARVIQLAGFGIPTGLISVPLRYMHTSVETASYQDIIDCGKLLAYFIASLPEELEEIACF